MPETPRSRQNRAEGLCGGAAKRCYGKLARLSLITYVEKAAAREIFAAAFSTKIDCAHPFVFYFVSLYVLSNSSVAM